MLYLIRIKKGGKHKGKEEADDVSCCNTGKRERATAEV
jgi:hypothetical protein